jgi:tautomerase-like protein
MLLTWIDATEGRSKEQIRGVLAAAHRAILATIKVPQRNRYQIYHEHPAIENGKTAEHRDTLEATPPRADWNSNGRF